MNLSFALLNDKLIHVDDVSNGLSCGCVCPQCGEDLVAKNNGKIKEHHFAHYSGSECEHGYETMLHLLAKEVIDNNKKVLLPKLNASINCDVTDIKISEEELKKFNKVVLEKRISDIVPDVIVYDENNEPLIIEIKVTHGIDDFKLEKIKRIGISTLEIDLSNTYIPDYDHMLECLTTYSFDRRWIYNKEAETLGSKLLDYSEEKPLVSRGMATHVEDCPIETRIWRGKSYANFIDDCLYCKYNLMGHNTFGALNCLGKTKVESIEDIQNIKDIEKSNGVISKIVKSDGSEEVFSNDSTESYNLFELWEINKEKPFLASNVDTGIAVFIKIDPVYQYNKYGKCYGQMYRNGYDIGSREIYGVFDNQWVIVPKK